jgi:excisionase family DNA binding protein
MGLDKLPEILTVKQLADFLQVTELTIRRALNDGRLKGFKIGRDWRIEKENVLEWLREDK